MVAGRTLGMGATGAIATGLGENVAVGVAGVTGEEATSFGGGGFGSGDCVRDLAVAGTGGGLDGFWADSCQSKKRD